MRKLIAFFTVALLLVMASLPLLAQDDDAADEATGPAHFRVVHLSPAVNTIVIFRDDNLEDETPGSAVLSGIRRGFTTRWIEIPSGTYAFSIGANSNVNAAAFGPIEVTFEAGDYVTLAVHSQDQIAVIDQDYSPLEEDMARITLLHGAEGAGIVDLRTGDEILVRALAYPGSFFTPAGPMNDGVVEIEVPAGTYDLTVVPNAATGPVLLDLSGTELEAGTYYFIAVYNGASGPAVFVAATTPEPAAAEEPEVSEEPEVTEEPAADLMSLLETGGSHDELSMFFAALEGEQSGLLRTLSGNGPFTVFIPTNEAFEATLDAMGITADDLFADSAMLTRVLRYHIVGAAGGGELTSDELTDGRGVMTLSGNFINVSVGSDGSVTLNGDVNVIEADVQALNGVIHVIDAVLMPE